jgi:hypothetical protein
MSVYLNKFCTILTGKSQSCSVFLGNIDTQFNILIQSFNLKNLIIFILVFALFFFLFKCFKELNKYVKIFSVFNFSLFLTIVIIFPSNMPFTDTWQEIYYLMDTSKKDYFLQPNAGHFFFGFRLFHLFTSEYFFLNYSFIHLFNFIIYLFSSLLLIFYVNKFKNIYLLLVSVLIIFSGKWMNVILEPVNIGWTINFLLTTSFVLLLNNTDNSLKYLGILFILVLGLFNFGSGVVLIAYSVIYGFVLSNNKTKSLFYIIVPICLYIIVFKYVKNYFSLDVQDVNLNFYLEQNFLNIIKAYLVLTSGIFFPTLIIHASFLAGFGFLQNIAILYFIISSKNSLLKNISKFIIENPLLVIGIIGCFLIATIRPLYFDQIRYSSYSIFFQIGLFIFILKKNLNIFIYNKKKLFLYFVFFSYIVSIIGPYTGIHFAISRMATTQKINDCVRLKENDCNILIYKETMYDGTWFDKEKFNKVIYFLKDKNFTFMRH